MSNTALHLRRHSSGEVQSCSIGSGKPQDIFLEHHKIEPDESLNVLPRAMPVQENIMSGYQMEITDREFHQMRRLIYDRFGINLTEQKRSLLVSRLQKHIRAAGFTSFNSYYKYLIRDKSKEELGRLVDRISTNYTYFNRENDHFSFFSRTALPAVVSRLKEQRRYDLRVWCAGCSTGEEAYMLLMLMHEFLGSQYDSWEAGILATDISSRALANAREGTYADERVSTLPADLKNKYFRRLGNDNWAVSDRLKQGAVIRRFNLMNEHFPFKKKFQIIFCRNVMIYFDASTRDTLVRKFYQIMETGGYLFIGHSETLGRSHNLYKYLRPAIYQKVGL
jgi:chemotaxis protein methyltransferase CheR